MILTKAIAGIARSNATRAGFPVLVGQKVPLYALSNVGRSGATRSNYVGTRTFISVGGVQRGAGILSESLTKSDQLNATPDTVAFTARGWIPVEGADVVITRGSINNPRREFGGTVLRTTHRYVGQYPIDRNMLYDVSCIDYTWGLDRRKVSGDYKQASIGAIAASLLTFAPGYTLLVDPDIAAEILDEITFTEQAVSAALTQLVKRVGGDYLCDYSKVVHLFFSNTAITPPGIVNAVHPTLADIAWTRDLSQVVTRVLGNFGGSTALDAIGPGETLLPVDTAAWYLAAGGTVLVDQQRVTYGGVVGSGGGSLVGPGAAPTAAINAVVVPGAGVTAGAHDYAVTYVTANGESIPSPRASVAVGVVAPPTTAPALDTSKPLLAGPGPDPGMHDYALSFVASSGETTPGPRVTLASNTTTPAPTSGPTPNAGAVGVGPDPGVHDYAVVFQTAAGYTTPGEIGGQISIASTPIPAPTVGPTTNPATSGGNVDIGTHWYYLTFATANGETMTGPPTNGTAVAGSQVTNPYINPPTTNDTGQNAVTGGWLYYSYAWRTASGAETLQSPTTEVQATLVPPPLINTYYNVNVYAYGSSDPAVTTVVYYRSFSSGAQKRQWATAPNVVGSNPPPLTDNCSNTSGPLAPTGGNNTPVTGAKQTIPLTNIPTGPAGTTARKIYRTPVGGGVQRLLATIANNSTTTYTDTTADSAMAGQPGPPGSNTALVLTAVHLTSIPRGTGADASTVIARLLYRRSGGAGLRYCGVLNDNSATTFDDTLANAALGAAPPATNTAYLQQLPLTVPLGGSFVVNRKLYRTKLAGGSTLYLVATFDNVQTAYTDTTADSGLGAAAPSVNTATAAQVNLSAVSLGPAAVTARRLYRTAAGASVLKLLATLADNTTTTYVDVLADAALGATAPASDTSALQQPTGNVLAGSPTLPCASVAAFPPSGGWAIVGSQNIRYTGISGNALLGIPATGPGAITATINWNTTAVAAAMLTGIPATGLGAIKYQILKGDPVNIFVQVDDLAAQAAVRAQLPGSDGIIEDEIQDGRLSYTEGRARCQARLDLLGARDTDGKVGVVTVSYICRDTNTQAGATVTVNLGPPINLRGDYLIQRVTVGQFHIPHLPPTYTVEASSLRFTAEDLLRVIRQGGS
jgi:hypothetical protein